MQRLSITPRPQLAERLSERGMLFHEGYYTETVAYRFSMREIEALEQATGELSHMCLKALAHVIEKGLWKEFSIPESQIPFIKRSWEEDDVSLYGRFDLGYNSGTGSIKLLEFNADTPTSLLEASVIQWDWLQAMRPGADQWNSIHEKLVSHLKACRPYLSHKFHFACVRESVEDYVTTAYLAECARQAGYETEMLYMDDISLNEEERFCTQDGSRIRSIFKLYPWEWMMEEEFATALGPNYGVTRWVEPPYKVILSSKMLLPILWKLFPNHPLLLAANVVDRSDAVPDSGAWVTKPIYSREGSNVSIFHDGQAIESRGGEYGGQGHILQRFCEIETFDGRLPVLGAWLVAGEPAGMGIREQSDSLITSDTAQFVPHYID